MRKTLALLALLALTALSCFAQYGPWPGQSGNAVGYAAAPGWPGSFTATACSTPSSGTSWANATVTQNCTFSSTGIITESCSYCIFKYVDFVNTTTNTDVTGTLQISGSHVIVIGCRTQSNAVEDFNIDVSGTDVWIMYTTVEPLVSYYTSPPGYTTWPSAGTDQNIAPDTGMVSGTNSVADREGYEYGIRIDASKSNVYLDHNDIWGYGNSIVFQAGDSDIYTYSNWSHDPAYPPSTCGSPPCAYHHDGPGYENGAAGPSNVYLIGNATGMMGNTQGLAYQAATSGYVGMITNENYWSGDNVTIAYCSPGSTACTNSTFYGNLYSTAVENNGTNYASIGLGTGSVWACNRVQVTAGTTWTNLTGWTPSSSENNRYLLYTGTDPTSTTDVGGNTVCAITNPAAYNFGLQQQSTTSASETVTLTNTNTASLSITSIAMQTGTQFSISSNTCGSTLASGASCTFAVTFAPTALGPTQDFVQVTDNSAGVTSPQLVPVIGVGCSSGSAGCAGSASAPSPPAPDPAMLAYESVDQSLFGVRIP